jgi:hypothetical protein
MTQIELLAVQHLDTCIESGEIRGDTALAIKKLFQIVKERDRYREAIAMAEDRVAELAVNLLMEQYKGFKSLVSYHIAAEVLRIELREALAKIRGSEPHEWTKVIRGEEE